MPISTAAQSPMRSARRTETRLARAERLRGERRHGGDEAHAEHETGEQDQMRQPDRRDGVVAEPADQRKVGRHHGDLAELGQRDRQRELDRFDDFGAPDGAIERRRETQPSPGFPARSWRGTIAVAVARERLHRVLAAGGRRSRTRDCRRRR